MKIKYLLIPIIAILMSCRGDAITKDKKGDFEVELLFEKDGCKVYRFYDGKTVYYTDCRGETSHDYRNSRGKSIITSQTLNSGRNEN